MRALPLLLPLLAACPHRLPATEPAPVADYSGLAPLGEGCVAVSDAKDPGAPRVFLVDGDVSRPVTGTDSLPVDLEAIAALGGDAFLVASGSGRAVALLRIVDGAAVDVRPVTFDVGPADQIEGLTVLPDGRVLVGTRGGDVRGTAIHYALDLGAGVLTRVGEPVAIEQPCEIAGARDIAELAVSPGGQLWAVGAVDPGDEGPFASCAFPLDLADGRQIASERPWRAFPGDKVEALAWCGGTATAGTDNEALPERVFEWEP